MMKAETFLRMWLQTILSTNLIAGQLYTNLFAYYDHRNILGHNMFFLLEIETFVVVEYCNLFYSYIAYVIAYAAK